jgi:hypothetical protein
MTNTSAADMRSDSAPSVLKRLSLVLPCLTLFPLAASALEISAPGHYVINSTVDEVIITDTSLSQGVSIEVVSGGVVNGDIRCQTTIDDCRAAVTVRGSGAVQGMIVGADANVTLLDSARVGRAGAGSGTGAAVSVSDNVQLDFYQGATLGLNRLLMTGGYVGANSATTEPVLVDISGGTIGSFRNSAGVLLEMSGGRILDGVSGDGYFRVKDGSISGGMSFGESFGDSWITGGAFNANANEYLLRYSGSSLLSISGGQFGNLAQGSGFLFGGNGTIDFWGRDLALTNGLLTGYLLDGSYISIGTSFSEFWSGTFNINNVPEPGTFGLLAVSLLGMGFRRRRTLVK